MRSSHVTCPNVWQKHVSIRRKPVCVAARADSCGHTARVAAAPLAVPPPPTAPGHKCLQPRWASELACGRLLAGRTYQSRRQQKVLAGGALQAEGAFRGRAAVATAQQPGPARTHAQVRRPLECSGYKRADDGAALFSNELSGRCSSDTEHCGVPAWPLPAGKVKPCALLLARNTGAAVCTRGPAAGRCSDKPTNAPRCCVKGATVCARRKFLSCSKVQLHSCSKVQLRMRSTCAAWPTLK